ncbi:aureocin A53 family class IId bacteriocin [Lactiplantibacillus paraplantarum]|uniref:aureocin A53 family class IId bacteriocin n=1 Tax=Lactiplantibacillus paraplantarum TaxID=60520 RepID=UPI003B2838D2
MGTFLKLVKWAATYGRKAVSAVWKHKGQILKWINGLQSLDWIKNKIKKWF